MPMNEISRLLVAHGGPVLFVVVFMDQAGLPVPSAPWLLAAGAFSAKGEMNATVAIGTCLTACLIANSLWFCAGRWCASRILGLFSYLSLVPTSVLGLTESVLGRSGLRGLVLAKFLPGLGMVVPALAGAFRVSVAKFLLYDSLGSLLYGTLYFIAGFLFHDQLQELVAALKEMGLSALLLTFISIPAYLAFKYFREWRVSRGRIPHGTTKREDAQTPKHISHLWLILFPVIFRIGR